MNRYFLSVVASTLLAPPTAGSMFAQGGGVRETPPASDAHAFSAIVGDEFIAENVRFICRRAAELDPADRFELLSRWVLPGADHPGFRVDGILTQTDPAPLALELDPAVQRSPRGAILVSPVFDLLDAAAATEHLAELRDRIDATAESGDELQERARAAMRVLVHLEIGQTEEAEAALAELHALAAEAQPESLHELWPETLVVYRGLHRFPDSLPVGDLLTLLYSQQTMRRSSESIDEWHTQVVSLLGLVQHLESGGAHEEFNAAGDLNEWVPVVRARARSRGTGAAHARWEVTGSNEAHHVAGHQEEYVFYRAPLRGDFTVECDVGVSGTTQLLAAGRFFGAKHIPNQLETGTFRDGAELQPFAPPFSKMRDWMHCRAVFANGTLTVFLNGRRVHEEQLLEHHDPWIGVRSWWRNPGRFRDFRITGRPVVPDTVLMSASPTLTGWLPYHEERAGRNETVWQWREDSGTGVIVGACYPGIAGSFRESLLRYHRPLDVTGSVEYEFFYEPGEVHTHPALDRLVFILEPERVRVHWITDGVHDRTNVPPDNLIDEPQNRRGPAPLPLFKGGWNQLKLSIHGDVAHLELNGQPVYERALEAANRRTFGLFHYSDRTEVRVRNVVMRGDWGDVPPDARQELADIRVAELDAGRGRLPSVFTHHFRDGIPDEHFRLGNSRTRVAATADGVRAAASSTGSWEQSAIVSRFAMQGDFDVEASFDELDTGSSEGESRIQLIVKVDGDPARQVRCGRLRSTGRGEHLLGQLILQYPDGTNRYVGDFLSDESNSGRLRLARRGDTVTMLFAQADSPLFRVIGEQDVGDGDVPIDGIHLIAVANQGGRCSVAWKDITLRAEQLKYAPEDEKMRRLYIYDADGRVRELAAPPGDFTHLGSPEWSPDGGRVTLDVSTGSTSTSHIFVVDSDSGEATDLGPGCMPGFSSDGSRIVFSQPGRGVMMMDADGSNRRVIDAGGWGVQWSPDGEQIAWGDSGNITLRNVASGEQRPLLQGANATRYSYIYWNLGWSHDSRSIAFKARRRQTGDYELAVADVDSEDIQVLYSTTGHLNADFTFSPDDKRVLFAMNSPEQPGPRLYFCNRNEPGPPTILPGQPPFMKIFDCSWSSEGHIAFAGQRIPQPVDWPPGGDVAEPPE